MAPALPPRNRQADRNARDSTLRFRHAGHLFSFEYAMPMPTTSHEQKRGLPLKDRSR
jgi:hypothetical protein